MIESDIVRTSKQIESEISWLTSYLCSELSCDKYDVVVAQIKLLTASLRSKSGTGLTSEYENCSNYVYDNVCSAYAWLVGTESDPPSAFWEL